MRILVIAEKNPRLEDAVGAADWTSAPENAIDDAGRLRVDEVIAAFASEERTLLITDRDLTLPACGRLFGFADHQRQIAVVSTFHLDDRRGSLRRWLANAIAHETGHLDGLKHCYSERCVMRPSETPADLDTRPDTACGRCPRRGRWWTSRWARTAAAALVLAGAVTGMEGGLRLALPEFDAPFS